MSENNLASKFYEGKPCRKCGATRRYISKKCCVDCNRKQGLKWQQENLKKVLENNRKWNKANPEKVREYYQKWIQANPEKKRESDRKYGQANRKKKYEYNRKWNQENPEKFCRQRQKWRQANPKKCSESVRKWIQANPEKYRECARKWVQANPEKVRKIKRKARAKNRAMRAGAEGSYSPQAWIDLQEEYDNRCLDCGVHKSELVNRPNKAERYLTPDHIIPLSRGGTNYITNIQPLCLPCNMKNWHHYQKTGSQIDFRLSRQKHDSTSTVALVAAT